MSRTAKTCDFLKEDLKKFSISLMDARKAKITKEDLKGIKEIIPDEKYEIRLTTGTRIFKVFNGTLLQAIVYKKQLKKNMLEEMNQPLENMRFPSLVKLFIENCYRRNQREDLDVNTIYDYIRDIENNILPFFSKYRTKDINSNIIENFLDFLRSRPKLNGDEGNLSERSVEKAFTVLKSIFNFAKNRNPPIILDNPCDHINNKPKSKRYKKELPIFKLTEAKYALKCIDKYANIRLKTFMNLIFSLGCRREEACGLRWCDIDFETGEVNYNDATTSTVPKRFLKEGESRIRHKKLKTLTSYRTNYLSEKSLKLLKNYYEYQKACRSDIKPNDYIFINLRDFTPADPNKISDEWRNFKKEYHIKDVDLHRIRHTVANILEKQGIAKKDIAKLLGNTERVLEEYYTHVDYEDQMNMRKTIDDVLFEEDNYTFAKIESIVKILNDYPFDCITNEDMILLEQICYEEITSDNYMSCLSKIKKMILTVDPNLTNFIESDNKLLQAKIETYNLYIKKPVKIPKMKTIVEYDNVLSL